MAFQQLNLHSKFGRTPITAPEPAPWNPSAIASAEPLAIINEIVGAKIAPNSSITNDAPSIAVATCPINAKTSAKQILALQTAQKLVNQSTTAFLSITAIAKAVGNK